MRRNILCSSKTLGAGRITSIWVLLGVLLLGALNGYGQVGRASINGTVTDQSGAMVPEARIVVTHTTTGQVREAATTENGTYVIPLLPVGIVSVTSSRTGFKLESRTGITLTADDNGPVDFTLAVGALAQRGGVPGAAARIATTTG